MRDAFFRLVLAGLLLGCGSTAPEPRTPPARPPAAASTARAPEPGSDSTLARADVDAVLDAGVADFLSHVEAEPEMEGRRFVGFRILSFFPSDERFADGPVQRGDVVLAVNGLALERPEDLFRLWQELRVASELSLDLRREGASRRLSWVIE